MIKKLATIAVSAALLAATSVPALAATGGVPTSACGVGKAAAEAARNNTTEPGASEVSGHGQTCHE